jgi:hypothetical protein
MNLDYRIGTDGWDQLKGRGRCVSQMRSPAPGCDLGGHRPLPAVLGCRLLVPGARALSSHGSPVRGWATWPAIFFQRFFIIIPGNSKKWKEIRKIVHKIQKNQKYFFKSNKLQRIYGLFYSAAYFGTLLILCNFQLIMKPTWINYCLNCIEFRNFVVIEYFNQC